MSGNSIIDKTNGLVTPIDLGFPSKIFGHLIFGFSKCVSLLHVLLPPSTPSHHITYHITSHHTTSHHITSYHSHTIAPIISARHPCHQQLTQTTPPGVLLQPLHSTPSHPFTHPSTTPTHPLPTWSTARWFCPAARTPGPGWRSCRDFLRAAHQTAPFWPETAVDSRGGGGGTVRTCQCI
jgi:hypothetical protein